MLLIQAFLASLVINMVVWQSLTTLESLVRRAFGSINTASYLSTNAKNFNTKREEKYKEIALQAKSRLEKTLYETFSSSDSRLSQKECKILVNSFVKGLVLFTIQDPCKIEFPYIYNEIWKMAIIDSHYYPYLCWLSRRLYQTHNTLEMFNDTTRNVEEWFIHCDPFEKLGNVKDRIKEYKKEFFKVYPEGYPNLTSSITSSTSILDNKNGTAIKHSSFEKKHYHETSFTKQFFKQSQQNNFGTPLSSSSSSSSSDDRPQNKYKEVNPIKSSSLYSAGYANVFDSILLQPEKQDSERLLLTSSVDEEYPEQEFGID